MEKKFEKGEFLTKVEEFAESMSDMISERANVKRGLIVLAAEEAEGENGTKIVNTVCGHGKKLAELIANLATQEDTKQIFAMGLKLGMFEALAEKFNNQTIF